VSFHYLPLFFENELETLFDYIGEDALFVSLGDVHAEANRFWSDVKSRYAMAQGDETYPPLPLQSLYLLAGSGTDKLKTQLDARGVLYMGVYENLDSLLCALKTELDADGRQTANIVFSPGATSFGMFNNEFDRGRQFMAKVKALFTCRPL